MKWYFILVLICSSLIWPPYAKSWLIGKDSDAGRDWGQEKKGMTEDEMAGWHHWLNGRESEWTPGDGDGQGGLACWDSWGCKESDTTERLNWTELNWMTYDRHLFTFLFTICISSLMKCPFMSFVHFLIRFQDFLIVELLRILLILWIAVLYQICILQIFSPGLWPVFLYSWQYLLLSRHF